MRKNFFVKSRGHLFKCVEAILFFCERMPTLYNEETSISLHFLLGSRLFAKVPNTYISLAKATG